jgi:hypothetical protein
MSASHAAAVSDLRLRLLANGYEPLPIIAPGEPVKSAGKRPRISDWASVDITPATVRRWATELQRDTNTGIRCGALAGVDIDVLDAALARAIEDLALAMLGPTPLRRIGRAPKVLLAYRLTEPNPKIETPEMLLPGGAKVQVEVLAQGQQFVSHGTHPDTGQPYIWTAQAPEDVPLATVPAVTPGRMRAFIAAAEAVFRDAGGRTQKELDADNRPEPQRPEPRAANGEAGGFFREVNSRALANADIWVKSVFPAAYWQPNATTPPGAWRVASADLGRGYEEDIAIHTREGCQDFGTRESLTPIDLVMRWAGAPDATAAAMFLCERLSIDPAALGWKSRAKTEAPRQMEQPSRDAETGEARAPRRALWKDLAAWNPAEIPRRPWAVPGYLMRGSVSVLSGQGAGGKSSLVVAWTIALADGEAIGGFKPAQPMVVVNYNTEDDRDEQQRRYSAALDAAGKDGAAVMPRIVRCGPHDVGTLFERNPDTGRIVPTAAMEELKAICAESGADVLVCDPLAELHNAEENDNTAMRAVIAAFRTLAKDLGIAVLILHHDRKGNNAPGDMDRVRGASAISGAVRVMLTLTTMTAEEADKLGVQPEERRRHFRIDGAKSNYAPTQEAEWWRLEAREIGNGEQIAACLPWEPPTPFGGLSMQDVTKILHRIHQGTHSGHAFGATKQTGADWAGRIITETYGKTDKQAAAILAAWEENGVLIVDELDSPRRGHKRKAYAVDLDAFSEMRSQMKGAPGDE